jgi:hypothetical protein
VDSLVHYIVENTKVVPVGKMEYYQDQSIVVVAEELPFVDVLPSSSVAVGEKAQHFAVEFVAISVTVER